MRRSPSPTRPLPRSSTHSSMDSRCASWARWTRWSRNWTPTGGRARATSSSSRSPTRSMTSRRWPASWPRRSRWPTLDALRRAARRTARAPRRTVDGSQGPAAYSIWYRPWPGTVVLQALEFRTQEWVTLAAEGDREVARGLVADVEVLVPHTSARRMGQAVGPVDAPVWFAVVPVQRVPLAGKLDDVKALVVVVGFLVIRPPGSPTGARGACRPARMNMMFELPRPRPGDRRIWSKVSRSGHEIGDPLVAVLADLDESSPCPRKPRARPASRRRDAARRTRSPRRGTASSASAGW